jgi:hypothetical protein
VPNSFQRSAADANSKTNARKKESRTSDREPNAVANAERKPELERKPKPERLPVTGDSDNNARR